MTPPAEYIIEFHRIGQQVKVTACDPDSGVEVSVMGAANTPQTVMTTLAIKKLHYVLAKTSAADDGESA